MSGPDLSDVDSASAEVKAMLAAIEEREERAFKQQEELWTTKSIEGAFEGFPKELASLKEMAAAMEKQRSVFAPALAGDFKGTAVAMLQPDGAPPASEEAIAATTAEVEGDIERMRVQAGAMEIALKWTIKKIAVLAKLMP